MKSFLRQAVARGKATRKPGILLEKLLAPVHPGNVLEQASELAADPMVDGMLSSAIHVIKERLPKEPTLLSIGARNVAENIHAFLPRLPVEGRRELRAVFFLAGKILEGISPEAIAAAVEGLVDPPSPPVSVKRLVGLFAVVLFTGILPVGDPDTAARACLEMWRIARKDENPEIVEEAWDMAVLSEADLEEDAPIPFEPTRAAG